MLMYRKKLTVQRCIEAFARFVIYGSADDVLTST